MRPHAFFERDGYDIYCDVPVTFADAALGAELQVPTIDGNETLRIPEGTQTGTTFTLKNKGVQVVNSKNRGNMYITVVVEVPKGLSTKQKDLLRAFSDSCGSGNHSKTDQSNGSAAVLRRLMRSDEHG